MTKKQFKDWEKKYETWKQENQNHPDKEVFAQYENQWQEWHEQLLQKKEQMQRSKAQQLPSSAQAPVSIQTSMQAFTAPSIMSTITNGSSNTDTTTATTATPGMYYQHPQYMYMQPNMYPGATPIPPGPAVVPPAILPSAVVPPAVVSPVIVPSVPMLPMMQPTGVPPQNPYSVPPPQDNFNQQPHQGMPGPRSGDTMGQHNNMNYGNAVSNSETTAGKIILSKETVHTLQAEMDYLKQGFESIYSDFCKNTQYVDSEVEAAIAEVLQGFKDVYKILACSPVYEEVYEKSGRQLADHYKHFMIKKAQCELRNEFNFITEPWRKLKNWNPFSFLTSQVQLERENEEKGTMKEKND